MDFCPTPWTEDATPSALLDCKECGLFEHGSRMIWGEGNPAARINIILDNPGERENNAGKEYVCGTRQTLQEAANHVGLSEHDLYITYVLKRRPKRKYDKERTRQICMQHLKVQLCEKRPSLILCLGNVAVQSFFQNQEAEVRSLRGKVHQIHGFQTIVAYHPLAIRRRPNLQSLFLDDWQLLAGLNKKNRDK